MNTTTTTASQTSISVERAMGGRLLRDRIFKIVMLVGGISVIIAVSSIFFYLASVVVPLFTAPTIEARARFAVPGPADQKTFGLSGEEQREIGARYSDGGTTTFFRFADGTAMSEATVAVPAGVQITSTAIGERRGGAVAYGLSDGRVILTKIGYQVTFPDNKRLITPEIEYPLGTDPLPIDERGQAIVQLAVESNEDGTTIAAKTADGRVIVSAVKVTTNLMTGETKSEIEESELQTVPGDVRRLLVEWKHRELYIQHDDRSLSRYDIGNKRSPTLIETVQLVGDGERVTALALLSGGYSLIVGTDMGRLAQWFPVREEGATFKLRRIREFEPMPGAVTTLGVEFFRKLFLVGDDRGTLRAYHATAQRLLFTEKLGDRPVTVIGVPPRGNAYLAETADGQLHTAVVHNEFPEVSFHSIWQKVWYESYEAPDYVWQSSAAASDFEPKFSLSPLTFGTLKAAFYAMLVAVPLAIMGAIFTAYFMSAPMRQIVKPTIEVMEALPTVIIGFLAGLWLAPYVENNLAGVLMSILLLPAGFVLVAFLWHLLPFGVKSRIPPGWEAALLIPAIVVMIWLFIQLGHPVEAAFFGGDMAHWLTTKGITFEQRNSLVVGIAMGFAVTPTIFSIAEDAVFSVPKSLTSGSLALGATPWQTLVGVVLLTASPGIFSAVMIGLGRAVGETMIVLMATGNTAVMDFSLFTGFRTLSANIGVEMPEAGVGETHYRLLFLSALVLFAFTFVVNTIAELIRQRLREKYQTV